MAAQKQTLEAKQGDSGKKHKKNPDYKKRVPIVGIGASAGGLEAFTELLKYLPSDTSMAFVLVQHLAPQHESMLTELLSKATRMPVSEVKDGTEVEANHIYVIPPNTNMDILHGLLHLMPRSDTQGLHMPIDYFLCSLAEDQGSTSIGVILSGTASDGALGLKVIKTAGGITFAQDEKTAKYYGMPRSAISAGIVDFVLSPEKIAGELARIGKHPYVSHVIGEKSTEILVDGRDELDKVLILLRRATGVDFTYYKHTTINRRIARRMVLHKIENLKNYIQYLRNNPGEVVTLFHDILINVTSFFRDPATYKALTSKVFPKIVENRSQESPIRIWVPGCSTGEEIYSIAICLLEYLGERATNTPIQFFATDISDLAIEKARAGIYLENITQKISPGRLRRFFIKTGSGYQIIKTIRDMCIFAKQNVTKDPPYSKLDLISCRNVLIYLGPVLHKKVMPIFHYALKPNRFLMLGTSETIGGFADLFALIDKKNKLYSKKTTNIRSYLEFGPNEYILEKSPVDKKFSTETASAFDLQRETDKILLNKYSPPGVVVNENLEILQFRGHTGPYLEPAQGEASLNLLKMAREGLLFDLRTAINNAREKETPIRKEGLRIKYNGQIKNVDIEVIPITAIDSKELFFLISFEDVISLPDMEAKKSKRRKEKSKGKEGQSEDQEVAPLKNELAATKEYLQSIIEDQETTNEEFRSANEKIQSSNEELQRTNEELETAKEELQSTNEELTTINEELENLNRQLSQVNDDLNNLLNSVNIPIIMLGNDLHIRRFTPMTERVLNVVPSDVGRKISDIRPRFDLPDLEKLIWEVIDTLGIIEREVQDNEGYWYSLRIRPYKTADNKIDGVVITVFDINALKKHQEEVQEAEMRLQNILDTIVDGIITCDENGMIESVTPAMERIFGYSSDKLVGRSINMLMPKPNYSQHENHIKNYLETGEKKNIGLGREVEGKRKDGRTFPMHVAVSELNMKRRRLFTFIFRDLSK
jgi:two-component system CheB/CheR fusion protein